MDDICHGLEWTSICRTKRGRNKVGYVLAQYARNSLDDDLYWIEEDSPPVIEVLYHALLL